MHFADDLWAKFLPTDHVRGQCLPPTRSGPIRRRCRHCPTLWTLADPTSTVGYTVAGLAPATQYLLQVRALGKRGASNWSDSIALTAT